ARAHRWAEERKAAGLRQQRADLHRAVTGAGPLDGNLGDISRRRRVRDLELGLRVRDAVVRTERLDAIGRDSRLAVAGELQRTGLAVVVDVLRATGDQVGALLVRLALRATTRDCVDLLGHVDA